MEGGLAAASGAGADPHALAEVMKKTCRKDPGDEWAKIPCEPFTLMLSPSAGRGATMLRHHHEGG